VDPLESTFPLTGSAPAGNVAVIISATEAPATAAPARASFNRLAMTLLFRPNDNLPRLSSPN
jgi:hypothetical protein